MLSVSGIWDPHGLLSSLHYPSLRGMLLKRKTRPPTFGHEVFILSLASDKVSKVFACQVCLGIGIFHILVFYFLWLFGEVSWMENQESMGNTMSKANTVYK